MIPAGNSIETATGIVTGSWRTLLPRALPIPMFVFGVMAASALVEIGIRRDSRAILSAGVLAIEATLLGVTMSLGNIFIHAGPAASPEGAHLYLLAALTATAMGMQNTTVRDGNGHAVFTTFVTGSLISASEEVAAFVFSLVSPPADDPVAGTRSPIAHLRPDTSRLRLYGGVFCAYVVGGVAAALLERHLHFRAFGLPVLGLLTALVWNLRRPLYR